jgi:hypothetical protein
MYSRGMVAQLTHLALLQSRSKGFHLRVQFVQSRLLCFTLTYSQPRGGFAVDQPSRLGSHLRHLSIFRTRFCSAEVKTQTQWWAIREHTSFMMSCLCVTIFKRSNNILSPLYPWENLTLHDHFQREFTYKYDCRNLCAYPTASSHTLHWQCCGHQPIECTSFVPASRRDLWRSVSAQPPWPSGPNYCRIFTQYGKRLL